MNREEKKLLHLFRALPAGQQETAIIFLEFLCSRAEVGGQVEVAQTPQPIPRPEEESVVSAIKRLRATYPMLDTAQLLHEVSGHMQRHILQGKPAQQVIDELEALFAGHYEKHQAR